MKITGFNGFLGPQRPTGPGGSKDASRSASAGEETSSAGRHANLESASDLARLHQQLHEFPEIRHDRLETVRARLIDGQYDTRAAAEATADAILGNLDRS